MRGSPKHGDATGPLDRPARPKGSIIVSITGYELILHSYSDCGVGLLGKVPVSTPNRESP